MFVLNKNDSNIIDQICLKNGEKEEVLNVSLHITADLVSNYRKLQIQLLEAQKLDKTIPENIEKIGKIVFDILCLLLGNENTKKIIDFFEDDYVLALSQLTPYISNTLVPKMTSFLKQYKKKFKW